MRAAEWAGWPLFPSQLRQLRTYGEWLREEAIPAGGIGPNESDRIVERHLADSILFAGGWRRARPPKRAVDLGSGVGLPGIPLAILWPTCVMTLIDRSGRRTDLARRAVRILDLEVEVVQGDAGAVRLGQVELVVSRAAAEPATVRLWARRLLQAGGVAVVSGSHLGPPGDEEEEEEVVMVPAEILDHPVWLRIMADR